MPGITVCCPACNEIGTDLSTADWENYLGILELGKVTRIGMVCLKCHAEFILTVSLSHVIPG